MKNEFETAEAAKEKVDYSSTKMIDYEKQIIEKTFDRCIGLQSALQSAVKNNDTLLLTGAIDSLAYQSGMSSSFIEEHLTEIIEL